MKRTLSFLVVLAMLVSLVCAVSAADVPGVTTNPEEFTLSNNGVRVAYNFIEKATTWNPKENPEQGAQKGNEQDIYGITYEHTGYSGNGNWEFFGTDYANPTANVYFKIYGATSASKENNNTRMMLYVVQDCFDGLTIKVPEAGLYNVDFEYSTYADTHGTRGISIYIFPKPDSIAAASSLIKNSTPVVSDFSFVDEDKTGAYNYTKVSLGQIQFSAAGEYVIAFYRPAAATGAGYIFPRRLILNDTDKIAPVVESVSAADSEIKVGETTTVTYTEATRMSDATVAPESGITYSYRSETPSVASVDDSGTVTGLSAGEAAISVVAEYDGSALSKKVYINVKSNEPTVPTNVSFSAAVEGGLAEIPGYENNFVASPAIGSLITVTAPEIDGYEFKYWKTSSGYASGSAEYSFNIYSNTWLYAVYAPIITEESSQVSVDFFNGNGNFISNVAVDKGVTFADILKPTASITGYSFIKWSLDDSKVINGNDTAVAMFEESGNTSESLTVDGTAKNAVYGEKVSASSDDAVYWTRDGKIVSFGKSYDFYAWGGSSEIVKHTDSVEVKPVVVLDGDKVDGAYMIEYDVPEGFEKVEAGIIFGNTSSITVNSCLSKAISRRSDAHGQFTASPNGTETVARGYLIYKNNSGDYKIVYSD